MSRLVPTPRPAMLCSAWHRQRPTAFVLVSVVLIACSDMGPSTADGFADVYGHVYLASGAPLAAALVAVDCGGRALSAIATTDSVGVYQVSLTHSLPAGGSRVPCVFIATTPGRPSVTKDTSVGFGPAGVPHALQFIDLREATGP